MDDIRLISILGGNEAYINSWWIIFGWHQQRAYNSRLTTVGNIKLTWTLGGWHQAESELDWHQLQVDDIRLTSTSDGWYQVDFNFRLIISGWLQLKETSTVVVISGLTTRGGWYWADIKRLIISGWQQYRYTAIPIHFLKHVAFMYFLRYFKCPKWSSNTTRNEAKNLTTFRVLLDS